jgi:hypothetical protein
VTILLECYVEVILRAQFPLTFPALKIQGDANRRAPWKDEGGIKTESLYQTDLYCIDGQLESLLTKLKDATPSERRLALLTLERTVTHFLDRVDAVDQAD